MYNVHIYIFTAYQEFLTYIPEVHGISEFNIQNDESIRNSFLFVLRF